MTDSPKTDSQLPWPLRERVVPAAVVAVGVIVALASLRAARSPGMGVEQFNETKVSWHNEADVVLAGDSRTMCGLSPAVMSNHLGGRTVRNFSFEGKRFDATYLQAVENVLAGRAGPPVIVLGITPMSLLGSGQEVDRFMQIRADLDRRSWLAEQLAEPLRWVEPMSTSQVVDLLTGDEESERDIRVYHPDGWLETEHTPPRPDRTLAHYRELFGGADRITYRHRTGELLDHVERWREQGIRVFAFRPPTPPAMLELENDLGEFDEPGFVRAFTRAGGTWLDVDPTAYATHDGSHLMIEPARRLSADLAERIARHLEQAPASAPTDPQPAPQPAR